MFELLVAFALCPVIYSQYDCCLKIFLMFGFSCTKLQEIKNKFILPNFQFQCCVHYENGDSLWSEPPQQCRTWDGYFPSGVMRAGGQGDLPKSGSYEERWSAVRKQG